MKRFNLCLLMIVSLLMLGLPNLNLQASAPKSYAHGSFFIPNHGQYDAKVAFYGLTDQGPLLVTTEGLWVFTGKQIDPHHYPDRYAADETPRVETAPIQLRFIGSNPAPIIEPIQELATEVAYFVGDDPDQWKTHLPTWAGVRYRNLYPGIDLELTTNPAGRLTRRLIVAPTADLSQIELEIMGEQTAQLTPHGLLVTTSVGSTTVPLFEVVNATGIQQRIAAQPTLIDSVLKNPFAPAAMTNINNDFAYYKLFNGANSEWVQAIAVSDSGESYFSGVTYSANFPLTNPNPVDGTPFQGGSNDAFVGGLTANGAVKFMTFLGGDKREEGYALAYDGRDGDPNKHTLVVAGYTNSSDFPADGYDTDAPTGTCTFGQVQETCYDVFVSRISINGQSIPDSTYIGGDRNDFGYGVAVESDGDVHITGQTNSVTQTIQYPTTGNAFQPEHSGGGDAFVSRFNSSLGTLEASTYLGGEGLDTAYAIALDRDGAPYVTGRTDSQNFPTDSNTAPYDSSNNGNGDMYVTTFNASSNLGSLYYSTFIGNTELDYGTRIEVENDYDAYVVGSTRSTNFPFPNNGGQWLDNTHGGGLDAVIIRLSLAGDILEYASFWGGSGTEYGTGLHINTTSNTVGDIYFAGETASPNLQTTGGTCQRQLTQSTAGFVVKVNIWGVPATSELLYSTYVAGFGPTSIFDMDVDAQGAIYGGGYDGANALAFKLKSCGTMLIPMVRK